MPESALTLYKQLPSHASLDAYFRSGGIPVPHTWWVAATDVQNSTAAIAAGRYKDVNVAGGLALVAAANALNDFEFPFLFGGDGVLFLIPPDAVDTMRDVLADTVASVREWFTLDLRAALIPVQALYEKGYSFRMARQVISPYYTQAILEGDALDEIDRLLKHDDRYRLQDEGLTGKADFTGFTCRWQDIPSPAGEVLTLIVRGDSAAISDVLAAIERTYGPESSHRPVREELLSLDDTGANVAKEAIVAGRGQTGGLTRLKIAMEMFITGLAMRFRIPLRAFHYDLARLKEYQVISSDYKKYDGTLKIVLSGTSEARTALLAYLDDLYRSGRIQYGAHVSDRAIMTCLLHSGSGRDVHFVDGADGGYTLAAIALKKQLLEKKEASG